jgi:hypothetical protein
MKSLCGCLVAMLAVLGVSPARAAVLCKARSGAMVVRQACKRGETQVDLTQFGSAGAAGAPGTNGAPGASGLAGFGAILKDVNNVFVGTILDDPAIFPALSTRALRTIEAQVVSFAVDAMTGFIDNPSPFTVFYEHPGCTGRAFVVPILPTGFIISQAQVHAGVAYYPVEVPSVHAYDSQLTFTTMGSCSGTFTVPDHCCTPGASVTFASEANTLAVGSLGLVPPFHVDAP